MFNYIGPLIFSLFMFPLQAMHSHPPSSLNRSSSEAVNDELNKFLHIFFSWLIFKVDVVGHAPNGNAITKATAFDRDHDHCPCVEITMELSLQGNELNKIGFYGEPLSLNPGNPLLLEWVCVDDAFPLKIEQEQILWSKHREIDLHRLAKNYLGDLACIFTNAPVENVFGIFASDTQEKELWEIHGNYFTIADQFAVFISSIRSNGQEVVLESVEL